MLRFNDFSVEVLLLGGLKINDKTMRWQLSNELNLIVLVATLRAGEGADHDIFEKGNFGHQ